MKESVPFRKPGRPPKISELSAHYISGDGHLRAQLYSGAISHHRHVQRNYSSYFEYFQISCSGGSDGYGLSIDYCNGVIGLQRVKLQYDEYLS